jgi:hypothetical protein
VHTHVIGENIFSSAADLIAGLEGRNLLAHAFDDAGELNAAAIAANRVHLHQNQIVLRLNHGHNLPAATGPRLDQKV